MRPLSVLIVGATAVTAVIHLSLYTDIILLLNGFGYAALAALYVMPMFAAQRQRVRWLLLGYTLVTFVAWLFVGARNTIGYLDKTVEAVLVVALITEIVRRRGQQDEAEGETAGQDTDEAGV
ncbi:MAG: hypothetical protein U5L04_17265 [Trueperaceae bacterium]|nr:hypothetical protein [Trueperaceae bacterium]